MAKIAIHLGIKIPAVSKIHKRAKIKLIKNKNII
jgi:hypothetical protein